MGGGGGSFIGGEPENVTKNLRKSERDTQDEVFRGEVEALLGDVLSSANSRDVEAIDRHLGAIRQALEKDVDGVVQLLFGGSVSKRTYVEGISDVDALVVINELELEKSSPREVCDYILSRLSERLKERVVADGFAINVEYADATVQLVPVRKHDGNLLLPNRERTKWSRIEPEAFTKELTEANKASNGKLVPVIKLAKVLLSNLQENRRPSGYHLENIAVKAFDNYQGKLTPREMIHHLFSMAPDIIRSPIVDKTGQSKHVDDYLGQKESLSRLMMADAVDRIGRRLRNAEGAHDIEQWRSLFETES